MSVNHQTESISTHSPRSGFFKRVSAVIILTVVCSSLVIGYSTGPPDGHTNAPGENNCTECHSTNALNTPGGSAFLFASQDTYSASAPIAVVITVQREGQQRWGFELTCLTAAFEGAGTLIPIDSVTTQVSNNVSGRQYLKHTELGTYNGETDVSPGWVGLWIAPPGDVGPVTFYLAANAANGNNENTEDFIYTETITLEYAGTSSCCVGTRGDVDCTGLVDIGDLTLMVDNLFINFSALCCDESGDIDASGIVDIGDLTILVDNLFITFIELPPCG